MLLALYVATQLVSTVLMSATMEKSQRMMLLILPLTFVFFLINFPTGLVLYWVTTNLWTVGQGLITRRLMPKTQPPPKRSSRTAPREEDGSSAGRRGARACGRGRAIRRSPPSRGGQAQEEEGRSAAVTETLQVEATGETVGEAKWSALRELEKLRPGIDKAAVQFQVLSEGERGLLGVGYAPARVIASVDDDAAEPEAAPPPADESALAGEVREILERILEAIETAARVDLRETTRRSSPRSPAATSAW